MTKAGIYLERLVNRQPNTAAIAITVDDSGVMHVMQKGRAEILNRYIASLAPAAPAAPAAAPAAANENLGG